MSKYTLASIIGATFVASMAIDHIVPQRYRSDSESTASIGRNIQPFAHHFSEDSSATLDNQFTFEVDKAYLIQFLDDGDPKNDGDVYIRYLSQKAHFKGEAVHSEFVIRTKEDGVKCYSARYGELIQTKSLDDMAQLYAGASYEIRELPSLDIAAAKKWFVEEAKGKTYSMVSRSCAWVGVNMVKAGGHKGEFTPVDVPRFRREEPALLDQVKQKQLIDDNSIIYVPDNLAIGTVVYTGTLSNK